MATIRKGITARSLSGGEASLIEATHGMAMSRDRSEAQMGRAMKTLLPPFLRFVETELDRDVSVDARSRTVQTMVSVCVSLTLTAAMQSIRLRRPDAKLLGMMRDQLNIQFDAAIAQAAARDQEPKP
jgi:hypothetical protein